MKVRICDKRVSLRGEATLYNLRVVECSEIAIGGDLTIEVDGELITGMRKFHNASPEEQNESWSLEYVVLHIDPKTKKASMKEMYLKDMVEL